MYRYTQWTGWKKNNNGTAMVVCIKDKEKLDTKRRKLTVTRPMQ